MKFAICNETFDGWDWQRTCDYVSRVGYDGIEIAPFTLADDIRTLDKMDRAEIRGAAESGGLEITGLHWLLVSPKDLSLTSADPCVRSKTSEYLAALVDFCADIGGKTMVLGSPKQRMIPEGDSRETAADRFCESVWVAIDRADVKGIDLCIEPLPMPDTNFLHSLSEARELIGRFLDKSAKTILDVKSACSEGIPIPDLIREYAGQIAHVHANDKNLRGPGFGDTDFRPILHTLNEVGYTGYVSVEVFDYSPDPETIATQSLEYLRRCSD